ncbi:MAG: DUF1015 family protein [Acidimicrobiia bacterium]
MARFDPFPAVRYAADRVELARVAVPPYDVIGDDERAALAARHDRSAVRIDLPVEEGGVDRYQVAHDLLAAWLEDGTLVRDEEPTFTVHRMSYVDDAGRERHTTGVVGALELTEPGTDILPHEHTTPKARTDRLDLLRSCRANLSSIWGLSLARGLTELLPTAEPPLARFADDGGVTHTVWRIEDPEALARISAAVAGAPVVIADGHHRYETSLAYKAERTAAEGDPGPATAAMTYVVERVEDELEVRAVHRRLTGQPAGSDRGEALEPWCEPLGPAPAGGEVTAALVAQGALAVVQPGGEVLVRPRPEALAGTRDLDSSRLDVALAALDGVTVTYQHGVDHVRAAVASGAADAGVLLRPATVAQIEATAHGGERMPPKTTFFHPKPKTGLVFRLLD